MDFHSDLGDGCHVGFEGGMIKLWTSDGVSETNAIYLEPEVMAAFLAWYERLRAVGAKRQGQG